jgi:hypothetical protein
MKNEIAINGTTFTAITYRMDGEDMEGLLIHDESDTYHDGDMIVGNGCEMPESAEDAEIILTTETGLTAFHFEDGKYIID